MERGQPVDPAKESITVGGQRMESVAKDESLAGHPGVTNHEGVISIPRVGQEVVVDDTAGGGQHVQPGSGQQQVQGNHIGTDVIKADHPGDLPGAGHPGAGDPGEGFKYELRNVQVTSHSFQDNPGSTLLGANGDGSNGEGHGLNSLHQPPEPDHHGMQVEPHHHQMP